MGTFSLPAQPSVNYSNMTFHTTIAITFSLRAKSFDFCRTVHSPKFLNLCLLVGQAPKSLNLSTKLANHKVLQSSYTQWPSTIPLQSLYADMFTIFFHVSGIHSQGKKKSVHFFSILASVVVHCIHDFLSIYPGLLYVSQGKAGTSRALL